MTTFTRALTTAVVCVSTALCLTVPVNAQTWNIDFTANDLAGSNYGAHTKKDHIGKSASELRTRLGPNVACASSYYTEYDAEYFTNRALSKEDENRRQLGLMSIRSYLQSQPVGKYVILRQYNFTVDPAWFYSIYSRDYGDLYPANGIRVIAKRVPYTISPDGVNILVSFPDVSVAYSHICQYGTVN